MKKWTGTAILALTLMIGGSAAIDSAAAAPLQTEVQESQAARATDFSAHRYYRRYYGYGYRPYYRRYYYARPYYYRPYPYYYAPYPYYAPAPFPLGFGFGFGFGPRWGW